MGDVRECFAVFDRAPCAMKWRGETQRFGAGTNAIALLGFPGEMAARCAIGLSRAPGTVIDTVANPGRAVRCGKS